MPERIKPAFNKWLVPWQPGLLVLDVLLKSSERNWDIIEGNKCHLKGLHKTVEEFECFELVSHHFFCKKN